MSLTEEKSSIIKQVKKIEDPELIETIKRIVKYGLKKQAESNAYNIPEKHKRIVRRRIKNLQPEQLIEWGKAEKKLKV